MGGVKAFFCSLFNCMRAFTGKENAVRLPKPCPVCGSTRIDHSPIQVICRACLFITSPDYWDRLPRWSDFHTSAASPEPQQDALTENP